MQKKKQLVALISDIESEMIPAWLVCVKIALKAHSVSAKPSFDRGPLLSLPLKPLRPH